MVTRVKPPVWFWIAGTLLLLWGLAGVAGFAIDRAMTPAMLARMSDYDRQFRSSQPGWAAWAYGIGTITGLIGTLALLLRRGDALAWYVISFVAVVILFGYTLGTTNLIAVKGFVGGAAFPIVIAVLCLVEIALARLATRRHWIA